MRRALPAALALAFVASWALAQDEKLIAVGDSITVGSSWPSSCGICPVIFDCVGSCGLTPDTARDRCGFVDRLDDWLGSGYYVRNEGVGGEDTSEALSRFGTEMTNNCAGNPGDCIAVLLMHGTNDMSGSVSPESARDNLASMVNTAKGRNVDVLLMTIVREVYDFDDPKWSSYRNLTLSLAASQDLQSVDPYGPLCDDNFACYNRNYWIDADVDNDGIEDRNEGPTNCTAPGPGDEGDNNLGHLDPDGYDVLTGEIQDVFPASKPSAPSPTSPMGTIQDDTPDFVWPEVGSARWYELEVDGSSTWWEEAAECAGGTCTVNPGVTLSEGPHSWRVRGRNLRGKGSWSADTAFQVGGPPGMAIPTAPTGEIFEAVPVYQWLPEPVATQYDLEVRDSGGGLFDSASNLLAANVCTATICSWDQGLELVGPETYTLTIVAENASGAGPPSSPGLDFSVVDCADDTPRDLDELQASPVTTTETVVHCGQVSAAENAAYTIDASGDLTVHTRDGAVFFDGFTVHGSLTVQNP